MYTGNSMCTLTISENPDEMPLNVTFHLFFPLFANVYCFISLDKNNFVLFFESLAGHIPLICLPWQHAVYIN